MLMHSMKRELPTQHYTVSHKWITKRKLHCRREQDTRSTKYDTEKSEKSWRCTPNTIHAVINVYRRNINPVRCECKHRTRRQNYRESSAETEVSVCVCFHFRSRSSSICCAFSVCGFFAPFFRWKFIAQTDSKNGVILSLTFSGTQDQMYEAWVLSEIRFNSLNEDYLYLFWVWSCFKWIFHFRVAFE